MAIPKGKTKITAYLPSDQWLAFRHECLTRNISGSQVLSQLVMQQLKTWQEEAKEGSPTPRS